MAPPSPSNLPLAERLKQLAQTLQYVASFRYMIMCPFWIADHGVLNADLAGLLGMFDRSAHDAFILCLPCSWFLALGVYMY